MATDPREREYREIDVLYRIREIVEPVLGKLMQDELVEAVRALKDERDALRDELAKIIGVADANPHCPVGHVIEHGTRAREVLAARDVLATAAGEDPLPKDGE